MYLEHHLLAVGLALILLRPGLSDSILNVLQDQRLISFDNLISVAKLWE